MIDVNDLIGKPYRLGGRGPFEYDCWGLVVEIYKRLGVSLPDYPSQTLSRTDIIRIIKGEYLGVTEPTVDPKEYDFVADLKKAHIGVYLQGRILHATNTHGVQLMALDTFRQTYTHTEFFRCR